MTLQEALKIIELNKDKLCGSMQQAIATLVDECVEKLQAVKDVLNEEGLL